MNESLTTYLSFYAALVAIVRPAIVGVILLGLWAALRRTKMDADAQKTTWFAVAIPLAGWLTAIWIVAASGALQARAGAVPLLPIALVLPIMIGLFALMRSERIAAANRPRLARMAHRTAGLPCAWHQFRHPVGARRGHSACFCLARGAR